MFDAILDPLASALGLLVLVNLIRWIAGVRFSRIWQILAAYGIGVVIAVLIAQFTIGPGAGGNYVLALPLAVLFELALFYRLARMRGG